MAKDNRVGILNDPNPPSDLVDNILAWHAINLGSFPGRGIHTDTDDHYNGSPVSLHPQWHMKEPW